MDSRGDAAGDGGNPACFNSMARGQDRFLPRLAYGIRTFERDEVDEAIVQNPGPIEEYINLSALRQARERFDNKGEDEPADMFKIWMSVSLALWLKHQ